MVYELVFNLFYIDDFIVFGLSFETIYNFVDLDVLANVMF